jgi:hypothetical protein
LVYFERFEDVHNAIEREKEIKGWLRIKKIALIVSVNPAWRDLSLEWFERHPFQPDADAIQRRLYPEPRGWRRRIRATCRRHRRCKRVHRSFAAKDAAQDDKSFGSAEDGQG